MKRLGVVTRRFAPAEGGIERFLSALCTELSRDFDLRVLTQSLGNEPSRPGGDDIFARNYPEPRAGTYPVSVLSPSFTDRLRLLPCALRLLPGFRRFAYPYFRDIAIRSFASVYGARSRAWLDDAIVVHSFAFGGPGLCALAAARHTGAAYIITPFVHEGKWGDSPSDIRLYNEADTVVALHEADADVLKRLGVDPALIRVCGVGIPPMSGNATRFRTRFALPGRMALFVGRLEKHKGYQELALAMSRLPVDAIHLILLGPHSRESREFAESIKTPNIRFLGHVSESEKQDALAACDLFCLPSDSEVMPMSILEAWSAGKPVLTGDIPALRCLVRDGETGVLVKRHATAVETALRAFLRDPAAWRAMGEAGRRLVDAGFRIARVADRLRGIYDDALFRTQDMTRGGG